MSSLNQRQALMALNGLPGLGPITVRRLLEAFAGEAPAILSAAKKDLTRVERIGEEIAATITKWPKYFDLQREEEKLRQHEAQFIIQSDDAYPKPLLQINDAPVGLYAIGAERLEAPFVGMVGTRRPSMYGRSVAQRFAGELAELGFTVVSGLARGVDGVCHEGALQANGLTAAFLGCSLDVVYPPEHKELYQRVAQHGALLSEYPFGKRADKMTFPRRNRLISGLCQAIIVVESDQNGGSMITARFAAEQGRMVCAVPGRIDQESFRGCHQLIRDGATLLTSVDQLVEELRFMQLDLDFSNRKDTAPPPVNDIAQRADLSEDERRIAQCFSDGARLHPDQVAQTTGMPAYAISAGLMMLELKRVVAKRADGHYEAR